MSIKKLMVLFLVSMMSVASLTGCNTMDGMEEDAEEAGDEIEDTMD